MSLLGRPLLFLWKIVWWKLILSEEPFWSGPNFLVWSLNVYWCISNMGDDSEKLCCRSSLNNLQATDWYRKSPSRTLAVRVFYCNGLLIDKYGQDLPEFFKSLLSQTLFICVIQKRLCVCSNSLIIQFWLATKVNDHDLYTLVKPSLGSLFLIPITLLLVWTLLPSILSNTFISPIFYYHPPKCIPTNKS